MMQVMGNKCSKFIYTKWKKTETINKFKHIAIENIGVFNMK